jgi:Tol biopolymer transport system component
MYISATAKDRSELWVADIDGANKIEIATAGSLATASWAPDNFHLSFLEEATGTTDKAYVVGADGRGLQQLTWSGGTLQNVLWSPDQKAVYLNGFEKGRSAATIWRENAEGSNPEKLADGCGYAFDVAPGGQYLLTVVVAGEKTGIYEFSLAERKCMALLPGVATFGGAFAPDGRSFLYAIPTKNEVTIYRQPWQDGKLAGEPQVALKLPFAFHLAGNGNGYDFSRDLLTVFYARPVGHADLYLLDQR